MASRTIYNTNKSGIHVIFQGFIFLIPHCSIDIYYIFYIKYIFSGSSVLSGISVLLSFSL